MRHRFPLNSGASKSHETDMTAPSGTNSNPPTRRSEPFWAGLGRRKVGLTIVAIVALALIGALIWYVGFRPDSAKSPGSRYAADRSGRANSPAGAIPVSVAVVRQGTFDVYLFALGTVTPLNTVLVRSRVDGQVMRVAFEEGQMVGAGDLIAEIDPRPFEVQLTLATGQLARDQALLENARIDLERYRTLLGQDSISRQQVDTQESLLRQYQAAVQSDQGGIDNAKLQLTHARIVAPISGRVGLRQIDPGNIVRATDATGIVVITQLQPIAIVFPIPEDALPRVMKRLRAGDRIPVEAFDRAQKEKLGSGRLLTVDNQIDTATGTVKLKAEFSNADSTLFANQFVNVRMPLETRQNATLLPTAAVQRGAAGTFVYVVKDDLTVTVTPVKLGPVQGEVSTVESGVPAGAKVVIDGADRLREGVKVELVARAGGGA